MRYFSYRLQGFTLIEVLIALAIISIALTALLKATGQEIRNANRIEDKLITHWIGMEGIKLIQLGSVTLTPQEDITKITEFLGARWYWRAHLSPTPVKSVEQITITFSKRQTGPFQDPLIGYRYVKQ